MTVVVGTAGHIDHGKTTLLRALTGIDADRLPEERRRGMTIDVGYAHLALDDGTAIDFVDVPGHDRLVGNMLVGAGEIDAAMLVVAADDGPRAQTLEHLALLDALGIVAGLVVVTKIDTVAPERVTEIIATARDLVATTSLAGSPVLAASGATGAGIGMVREALVALRDGVAFVGRPPTIAIDRVFSVKGRGVVVTGTLRGGPLNRGDRLRLVPGDEDVRIREIQVHGEGVARVEVGGRTALNLAGVDAARLHRGQVLTADPAVRATDRILVTFRAPVADRGRGRLHGGTAATDAAVGRSGRDDLTLPDGTIAGIVRLGESVALRPGDRFVLRRGPTAPPVGGTVLDTDPPRGISRRRQTPERVAALAARLATARLELHGALEGVKGGGVALAPDVAATVADQALASVDEGVPLTVARARAASSLRRTVTLRRDGADRAAIALIDRLIADSRLIRDDEVVRPPDVGAAAPDPMLLAAMDRLELALATPAPPSLASASRAVGCPADGIRALERAGRIAVLGPDLAYAMSTYRDLAATALRLAAGAPLSPAVLRNETGTSRKYVMAILADLDRRAILRRTPDGHVPGSRAPSPRAPSPTAPT
ncbi:MAG: selenocysteine-specific translation elongation factor [Chloroflexi bacterium]|nr:selenocysteine-specific translation elongation factor [Chloroflexota bacterium]